MSEWTLSYEGYDPKFEGLRETLCTLGNGYMASRGAAANALADDTHYPGTYLAGGYNRLTTEVAGHEVENEDLVNIPNWLPLVFRIDDGPWLRPQEVEVQDYRLALSIHDGVLSRALRLKDVEGRDAPQPLEPPLADEDRLFEFMLNALRLRDGFDEALLEERALLPAERLGGKAAGALDRGLIERSGAGRWRPTALGRRFLDDLQAAFLP